MNRWSSRGALTLGSLWAFALYLTDPATSGWFPACWFHALTGLECFGCGGQRAVHELLHGHLGTALHENALALVVLPGVTYSLVRSARLPGATIPELRLPHWSVRLLVVGMIAFGVLRNL